MLLATVSTAAPAHAAASTPSSSVPAAGTYVALGDSYAAGAGIPAQSAGACMRSDHDYGRLVAAGLAVGTYRDVSCAGAKVGALTTPRTDAGAVRQRSPARRRHIRTTLVTVTIAGDDLGTSDFGFADVAATCSTLSVTAPLGTPCHDFYGDTLGRRLDSAAAQLGSALKVIHDHAPGAEVLVVGYPAVLPDDPFQCLGKMPVTTGDIAFLRSVLGELNDTRATTARAADATRPARHHRHVLLPESGVRDAAGDVHDGSCRQHGPASVGTNGVRDAEGFGVHTHVVLADPPLLTTCRAAHQKLADPLDRGRGGRPPPTRSPGPVHS
ncbi:GDSL-type esterase/lipase family protein [Streptomyces sp. NPDC001852]|uniref:GDSL-type esterase/lipase family protein n=1 Tax=Streptomyces sp. NPDC001852 TaxID=3364619 RepID=UPI0036CA3030